MAGALREVLAEFGVAFDDTGLKKGNKGVDSLVSRLKGVATAVAGAFALREVVSFGKEILNQADVLAKQSGALGVSAEELQGWQHAAALSGSSAEEFTAAFTKFTRNVSEASDSAAGPAAQAFKRLGVSVKDSSGQLGAPIDLLDGVVSGLQGIQDPAKRTAAVMDLFGKSGARLLPLFDEGVEGIAKLRQEVKDLGASFDADFLANAQEVNDNVDRMKAGLRGLAIQVLGPILPGLVELTQRTVRLAKSAVGFVKNAVSWVRGTKLVQTALVMLGGKGVLMLARAIPALIARLGGLRAMFAALGRFILRAVLPFLVLEDIIVFLAGGDSALGDLIDAGFGKGAQDDVRAMLAELTAFFKLFTAKPDEVRRSFADLPKDLERDLGGFGSFLGGWGQNIVEVGLFAANALSGGWENFLVKMKALGSGVLLALNIVWTELKFAGLGAAASLSDAFDAAWSGIVSGAQAALNAMLDVLAQLPGTDDVVKGLRVKVSGLDSAKAAGGASEEIAKMRDKARLALAAEGDRIGAVATAPAASSIQTVTNNDTTVAPIINVTVPPGTDSDLAKRVGVGAGKASSDASLAAVKAAVVPGGAR